jgi:hypothetical protein
MGTSSLNYKVRVGTVLDCMMFYTEYVLYIHIFSFVLLLPRVSIHLVIIHYFLYNIVQSCELCNCTYHYIDPCYIA